MLVLRIFLWFPVCAAPGAALLWFLWRAPPQRNPLRSVLATFAFGMLLSPPAAALENALARLTGIADQLGNLASPTSLLFVILFSAPLEEALKVGAAWPAFRSGQFDAAFDGVLYSTASATGFASLEAALVLGNTHVTAGLVARTFLILVAQPLAASYWGYALGKVRRTRTPTVQFTLLWFAATFLHGLLEHLTASRSAAAMVAAIPLLAAMALVFWWITRDLLGASGRATGVPSSASRFVASLHPPSLQAVRQAVHRADRPVLVHWIGLGALTTTGVILAMLIAAIGIGRFLGFDFSVLDRADSSANVTAPLVLLIGATLTAFPIAGYLVARASHTDGVLEPALAAAVAIVAVLIMLGLAGPVALVLALAVSPIAFALACGGAWVGLGK